MTPLSAFRLVLGACALTVAAGGAWLAVLGGDSGNVTVTGSGDDRLFASPAAGLGALMAVPPAAAGLPATNATAASSASPELAATTETHTPTPEPPVLAPRLARPGAVTPVSPPTLAATLADLPTMSATAVLALAREVRLPSGKTLEACGALGPEGEPWPFSVHLYYTGRGGWVVATHRGDASLLFNEATRTFHVDTVTRAGC